MTATPETVQQWQAGKVCGKCGKAIPPGTTGYWVDAACSTQVFVCVPCASRHWPIASAFPAEKAKEGT